MKHRRRSGISLPSPLIAAAVGVLCIAYIQLSHSATIPERSSSTTTGTKQPSRITTLKTGKPRVEVQAGRMKASDIKACISKAFCEVNSASRTPNYAVNKEFFDLMNQIHALSDEELDSGSTSVEYDDDDDEEDDDASGSSEESSSERLRGYPPPPPPPPPGYRRGREFENNGTATETSTSAGNATETTTTPKSSVKKAKDSKKKNKKKNKTGDGKMVKKYVNGTFISVPKRRSSRIETAEEKAEKQDYVNRKQREMGQVNDLAALIRISADIGLTLRSPKKCRTLFNKCTMSHEQIVDLFNQTLIAVTTPSTSNPPSVPTTKRAKVTTTLAAAVTSDETPEASSSLSTVQQALTPTQRTSTTTLLTTSRPTTSTTVDDGNRSSKSRHDFSDEDVEYMTDTEIAPVQTYALFVNDAPEDAGKTVENVDMHETFKQYANAFPVETALPGDIPSLRKRSNKKKSLKPTGGKGRSSSTTKIAKRRHGSSEEDEDDDDEEEDDDVGSTSVEDAEIVDDKGGYRIDNPYSAYRVNKGGLVDDEKSVESAEPASIGLKDSNEGILPPLVQKEKPKNKDDEEDDEDEESSEEDDLEPEDDLEHGIPTKSPKKKGNSKISKSTGKRKGPGSKKPSIVMEESSEEEELEAADDPQTPQPWTPVYQMYMSEKKKQGYKKKQKGPYKGGEGFYDDTPSHHAPQPASSSFTSFLKKPWGGNSAAATSQEIPGQPPSLSHESVFQDYNNQQNGGHYGGHGGGPHGGGPHGGGPHGGPPSPYGNSQETGGASEQKPGFFQSIMSWFTGGQKAGEQGAGPYGGPGGQHAGHHPFGGHGGHGSAEHDEPQSQTGAAWPSQPDPAGVGHFGQSYRYRGYPKPSAVSSEESEELIDEPVVIKKKDKQNKRRYRGRSDSIITSPPKKSSSPAKKSSNSGPPPPVVVVPKDSKSVAPAGNSPVGVYEPNHNYEKLIQADGGLVSGERNKMVIVSSTQEKKRSKKAAVKPKSSQKKKSQKQSQRASRESAEDDDEAFSSEELFNQQVAKIKSGSTGVNLGGNNNGNSNSGGSGNSKVGNKQNDSSFPQYFESMFGTEAKDKYKIRGNDDGSLLYGFDSLSSQLNAHPQVALPTVPGKKKTSSYKVNKNKKKKKNGGMGVIGHPVKFNNKEIIEDDASSEEKKKK